MEQRQLGRTGLTVSRLALGTMTWGRDTDEHEARDQLVTFCEAGGTLVDTADVYADGASERVLGSLLGDAVPRDAVVLASKAVSRPGTARRFDASRGHLLSSLDASLARLGTDYLDLWQLHAWDPNTPLAETLAAADVAVQSGRVRYIGVSNYCGWQMANAATWQSAVPGRTPVASTQVEYSLLQRGVEREVLDAARNLGMGVLVWSPLGRGVLTGKYRTGTPADSRAASPHFTEFVRPFLDERSRSVVEAVVTAASGLGVSPLEVALAWVRDRPGVTSAIVGA
ncbi:MAG TPA: aldo/keto reductase, partial [Actinomycetes bacterium]|nr:aldo/keto reductase [Actinomycetes bacterium]